MAHWPLNPRPTRALKVARASSAITQATATGGAAHVKGAWVEMEAATTGRVRHLTLYASDTATSAAATDMLLDVGVGAAGAEQTVISNLLVGYLDTATSSRGPQNLHIPLSIPAGTRLAARIQGLIASDTLKVGCDLWGGVPWEGVPGVSAVRTYGVNTATSKGTVVTAAGTANTKGAWADITTATTLPHRTLMLLVQPNSRLVAAAENWTLDIGVWNGSAYDVIWPDRTIRYFSSEVIGYQTEPLAVLGFSLPVGARLGVRGSCTTASLTLDVAIYGMG